MGLLEGNNGKNGILTVVFTSLFLISLGMAHNAFADQVIATIPIGNGPTGIGVNPNTNMIYVAANGATTSVGPVIVIDGNTNTIKTKITVGSDTWGVGVNPNTNMIYVAQANINKVTVINGATNSVVDTISIRNDPTGIGVNPNTNMIYVSNSNSTVSVIDGATNSVVGTVHVGWGPLGIGVNPNTNMIYVANNFDNTTSVIDGATNSVVGTVHVGNYPEGVGVNPNTNMIYVANTLSNTVSVIDGSTNSVVATIPVGSYPQDVGVNPDTNKIYVTNNGGCCPIPPGTVSVINGTTNSVVDTIPVGKIPVAVGVNPNTSRIYVANNENRTISVIDGSAPSGTSSTATVPAAPQNLVATTGNSQVSLSWTAPTSDGGSALTGYNVYRGTSLGAESLLTSVSASTTSYTDTAVTSGVTYYYYVAAINSVGTSSPSNTASATTSGVTIASGIVLNNVQLTSGTTSTSNQITLSGFNAGTGSNQLLLVGISANNNSPVYVTFNGMPLTQAVSSFFNNDAEFWYLKNPSGTGNIVVTMSGPTQAVVGAYSFSGVSQTSPIPATVTGHNTSVSSPAISIMTKYANDLVLDLSSIWGGVTLGSPTCTQQWDVNVPNAITGASSSTMVQSPSAVTCKWSASSADFWDDVAVELKAN